MFDRGGVELPAALGSGSESGLEALVKDAATAVAEALALDLDALGDGDVRAAVGAVEALHARVEALAARVVGCFDARRLFEADGARNTTGWLRTGLRVERARAARLVRVARGLRGLPATWCAYAAGEITAEVVARIVRAANPRCAEALRRDETVILSWARSERFDVLARFSATRRPPRCWTTRSSSASPSTGRTGPSRCPARGSSATRCAGPFACATASAPTRSGV
jgi:hypothetical protein